MPVPNMLIVENTDFSDSLYPRHASCGLRFATLRQEARHGQG
jgi:hypothetical protein